MVSDVDLRVGGSDAAASSLRPTVAFLRRAAEHGWPANVIVLVHTECHPTTGALFYGNREQDSAYSNLPDLLAAFLGGRDEGSDGGRKSQGFGSVEASARALVPGERGFARRVASIDSRQRWG
jgi:hypothetical protein